MNTANISIKSDLPLVLHAKDIQVLLGISKGKTYEIMNSADFPTIYINKRMLVTTEAFLEWLSQEKRRVKRRPIFLYRD
ncbi:MAG: DNA-binding protein [Clostridia bacterium]|nr:DNA-binding protein [Clostridia bacterium]